MKKEDLTVIARAVRGAFLIKGQSFSICDRICYRRPARTSLEFRQRIAFRLLCLKTALLHTLPTTAGGAGLQAAGLMMIKGQNGRAISCLLVSLQQGEVPTCPRGHEGFEGALLMYVGWECEVVR